MTEDEQIGLTEYDSQDKSVLKGCTESIGCSLGFFILLFILGLALLPFLILTGILSNP
jgi:hypothetical protein